MGVELHVLRYDDGHKRKMKLKRKSHVRFNPASAYSVLAGVPKSETAAMDFKNIERLLDQINTLQRQLKKLQIGSPRSDAGGSYPSLDFHGTELP
jgi:hypothetical protein